MKPLVESHPIKLCLEHNISSSKILQAKYDLNQTILSVKQNVEKRYGTDINFMKLILKDKNNGFVADLDNPSATLGSYGAQDGYVILVMDSNPNSIHKEIEDMSSIEKYKISEEDYDKLGDNFKKWKKDFLEKNPQFKKPEPTIDIQSYDPDFMKEIADKIAVGNRVKVESGARGEIKFVGKIMDKGPGYFVGVKLDQPYGNCSGTFKGVKYFEASDKYAMFLRPDKVEVGDFPELDIDDQI